MARPSKLTDEMIAEIAQYVEAGNYVEVACAAVGISDGTYYSWGRIGRDVEERIVSLGGDPEDQESWPNDLSQHETQCLKFARTMKKATARSEAYAVAVIRKHMPDQWTAAMTYLERRYPARWKRRDLHEVAQLDATKDREIDQALLEDPEAVRQFHEALERVSRAQLEQGS